MEQPSHLALSHRHDSLRALGLLDGEPDEAFDRLTRLTCRLLRVPVSLLTFIDGERQYFKSRRGLRGKWSEVSDTPLSLSFCRNVIETGRLRIVTDAREHPDLCDNPAVTDLGVCAYLAFPVLDTEGEAVASLCAIDMQPRTWSHSDVDILGNLAAMAGTEIDSKMSRRERQLLEAALDANIEERARAETELRARIRELEIVYQLSMEVTRARSLSEIYDRALQAVIESLKADRASLLLFDDVGVMRFKAWRGLSDEYRKAVEGHSPWSADEREARPITVDDVRLDPSLKAFEETIVREGIRGLAFIPLVFEERLLGKFMAYFDQPHRFVNDELQLVQTIANHVAFAIERRTGEIELSNLNESLEERVRQRTSELTRVNDELVRRNEDLENFANVASHDLQEPLRKISSFSDLMRNDYADKLDASALFYLERIQSSAVRMSHLLSDLMKYSRLTMEKKQFKEVDLNEIATGAVADLQLQIDEARGEVHIQDLPRVYGDPTLLRQLLQNLVSNAVKYRRENVPPRIRIEGAPSDKGFYISVLDNGIGFEEKYSDRIFQPFQRLHPSGYSGSGIGLAICRRIVETHEGKIAVKSRPGKGTVFTIQLPGRT